MAAVGGGAGSSGSEVLPSPRAVASPPPMSVPSTWTTAVMERMTRPAEMSPAERDRCPARRRAEGARPARTERPRR